MQSNLFITEEQAILEAIKSKQVIGIEWESIDIPEVVKVNLNGRKIRVEGPRGVVEKDFSHVKSVHIIKNNNMLIVAAYVRRDRDKKPIRMVASKIRKMIEGVQKWFVYKHKVAFAHFPIRVNVEGRFIIVENFYGRRDRIKIPIVGDQTKVEVRLQPDSDIPDEVVIMGPDLEAVSQTSANLQEACKLRGKFRKDPRVFQDGIWRYMITREGEE